VRARLLTLALVAGIAAATASGASPATRTFRVTEAQAAFPERAYILSLPTGMQLSAKQVRVFENGVPVKGASVVAGQTASADGFGVALLVDASQSMEGAPERAALAAARAFAAQRQPHEQVAVLTYNVKPNVLLPFTTDQQQIDGALSKQPPFQFGTHMYDAVVQAIDELEAAHVTAGSIVVLSDGQEHRGHGDKAKHETAKTAAAAARAAHVRVFTVGLKSRFFKPKALDRISRRTGGQYLFARSLSQLNDIYRALGSKLAREYLVRYTSNANPGQHIVVSIRVDGFPGIVTSGYTTPSAPREKKPGPYHESFLHRLFTSPLMMVFIALISASLVALAVVSVASGWKRGTLRKRMAEFVSMPAAERERPSGVLAAGLRLDRREEAQIMAEARRQLARIGLAERAHELAGSLPLGTQRVLEIARALAADPVLLVLDEPAAGLRRKEKQALGDLLRKLRGEGVTILIVEHDMDFVMKLVDRLVVMNFGSKLIEGEPAVVRADPGVQAAYLGSTVEPPPTVAAAQPPKVANGSR